MAKAKELPTQEYLQSIFDYNPETGFLYWKSKNKQAGCKADDYIRINVNSNQFYAHRLIWKYHTGNDPVGVIDHISRDKLDNRIENLRDVPNHENSKNNDKIILNEYNGISYNEQTARWRVRLTVRGNIIHLGYFKGKEDAIKARKEAELTDWSHLEAKSRKSKFILTYDYLMSNYYYEDGNIFLTNGSKIEGNLTSSNYIRINIIDKLYLAHRIIYWLCTGIEPPKDMVIDHISGVRTDNRIENLRLVTKCQNAMNRKVRDSSDSGVTGVYCNNNNKWKAYICVDRKQIHLGTFNTKEEAILARKQAEELYHGEYARQSTEESNK